MMKSRYDCVKKIRLGPSQAAWLYVSCSNNSKRNLFIVYLIKFGIIQWFPASFLSDVAVAMTVTFLEYFFYRNFI